MIKITVELIPFGNEEKKKTIAGATIWNDGTGSPVLGSYGYELFGESGHRVAFGHLGEFKRKQYTVWWLIAAILKSVYGHKVEKAFRDNQIRHKDT